jgi:hypothetical protein
MVDMMFGRYNEKSKYDTIALVIVKNYTNYPKEKP